MDLHAGQSLAHYEILGSLGAGAMGEVYRARDTRLEREVALKVLPEHLADDEERLRRFEREAKSLASLSHPNVAQVYGIDQVGSTCFIAMELVPGEDLAAHLRRSALAVEDALEVGRQIAEGVEAAHEAGVIHRDLKPANVIRTPSGRIKVLDFGLAKPTGPCEGAGSTTEDALATAEGQLLGTPVYMAPEQIRCQPVDRRVDVWAFGCVLFECLSGRRAFDGETTGDVLAAVLEKEPNWSALPAETPRHVRALLARCFDKHARTRLRDLGEARIALESSASLPSAGAAGGGASTRARLLLLAPTLALAVALVLLLNRSATSVPQNPLLQSVPRWRPLEGSQYDVAVTPGGDAVVFGSDAGGRVDMWRWSLESGVPENLTGGAVRMIDELVRNVGLWGSVPWVQDNATLALFGVTGPGQPLDLLPFDEGVEVTMSRDGERALYHTHETGDPIFIHAANVPRGEPLDIGGPGIHLHYPAWSTDEEWVYYSKGVPGIWAMDLWRVRVDGSDATRLTTEQLDVAFPTPIDEDTVLFIAKEEDGSGPYVFCLDVPSGYVQKATVGVEHYTSLHACHEGRIVVTTRATPTSGIWRVPLRGPEEDPAQEADVEAESGTPELVARSPAVRGERLFYLQSFGGGDGLYVRANGRERELWEDANEPLLFPPSVSPSGELVALVRRGERVMKLAVLQVSSKQLLVELETDVDVRGVCTWSPDETSVVISGIGPDDQAGLFRISLAGGVPEQLASGPVVDPSWSQDRDLIVFGTNSGGGPRMEMHAIDSEGRPLDVDLSRMAPRFRLGAPARFTQGGDGLVYLAYQGKPFTQQFFHLDLATGASRQLTELDLNGTIRAFDLTPDGRHIVFDRTRQNSDVVVWDRGPRAR